MIRVNREVLLRALLSGAPLQQHINRAVGKTTGGVLMAIAQSIESPGQWFRVQDPDITNNSLADDVQRRVLDVCSCLGLEKMEVRREGRPGEFGEVPPRPGSSREASYPATQVWVRSKFAEQVRL